MTLTDNKQKENLEKPGLPTESLGRCGRPESHCKKGPARPRPVCVSGGGYPSNTGRGFRCWAVKKDDKCPGQQVEVGKMGSSGCLRMT